MKPHSNHLDLGTCALCRQRRFLHKSHIIPEFLYRSLYDDKHRLQVMSVVDQETKYEQKGRRERLLCGECEQKVGQWERYAALVLSGGVPLQARRVGDMVFFSGVDYAKFRLFQLSILWRAGVAKGELFSKVSLGPHEDALRTLLDAEDAGAPTDYGCLMFGVEMDGVALKDIIMQPTKARLEGVRTYRFLFGGFVWAFLVSAGPLPAVLSRCVLQRDGSGLFLIRSAHDLPELRAFADEHTRREGARRFAPPSKAR